MPHGVRKALGTSQAFIDNCLRPNIDDITVCYLCNLLMYSTNEKEHEDHSRQVLRHLEQFGVNCNADMLIFVVQDVGFVRYVIISDGLGMESAHISTIKDWLTSESVWGAQVYGSISVYGRI